MKSRKMVVAALSCMTILTLVLSACSGNKDNAASQSSSSSATEPASSSESASESAAPNLDPFGKYDPPITVKAARPVFSTQKFLPGEDIGNNAWIKLYRDALGINVEYAFTASGDGAPTAYDQKLNVAIASGSLPDFSVVNIKQLSELANAGKLEDMKSLLDQYGSPELKDILNRDGGRTLQSATIKGILAGMPILNAGDLGSAPMLWIRTDWLTKLNLTEPKTMDDVYKIAEAFTNQDPNGDGKPNTYGIAFTKDIWSSIAGFEGFFQGFHAYPSLWTMDDSGKLAFGSIQPQMKQALAKLQELYKAGVIDKEFGVKDAGKVVEDIAQNKVGMLYGLQWMNYYPINDGILQNPEMDWQPYVLPSADETAAKPGLSFTVGGYLAVKKGAEHPEALIKLLNIYYQKFSSTDPEDFYTYMINKDDPSMSHSHNAATLMQLPLNYDLDIKNHLHAALNSNDPSTLRVDEQTYYKSIQDFKAGDRAQWATNRQRGLEGSSYNILEIYSKANMPTEFYGAVTPTMVEKQATLDKIEKETFAKIIMGSASIDEFDAFVSKWKELGGDQITQEVNDWKTARE